jgi:hypothetical protein
MSWNNLANVVAATNTFKVVGNVTAKYRIGLKVKVRGTVQSDGIYGIINSVYVAGSPSKTSIVVAVDLTETTANTGEIAIRVPVLLKGRKRKRRGMKPVTKRTRRKTSLKMKGRNS